MYRPSHLHACLTFTPVSPLHIHRPLRDNLFTHVEQWPFSNAFIFPHLFPRVLSAGISFFCLPVCLMVTFNLCRRLTFYRVLRIMATVLLLPFSSVIGRPNNFPLFEDGVAPADVQPVPAAAAPVGVTVCPQRGAPAVQRARNRPS